MRNYVYVFWCKGCDYNGVELYGVHTNIDSAIGQAREKMHM